MSMRRPALLLTLVSLISAGCASPEPTTPSPAADPAFFDAFALTNGERVASDASSALFRWEGTVGPSAGGATAARATSAFEVPPGADTIVTTTLTWEGMSDLELFVRLADGELLCSSTDGPITSTSRVESCRAGAYEGRSAETWVIEVFALDDPNPEMAFVVEVLVTLPQRPSLDAEVAARFDPPVLVGPGADGEASLFIAPDGTMLICTHGAFQIPTPLWASQDHGATWTQMDPQPNPIPSGDCDVAITDDGTWYIVYDTIASATIASSTDQGQTWQIQPVAAQPVTGAVDRPWLLADGNDITMTYANAAATLPAAHWFSRSTDRGLTWPLHTPMGTAEGPGRVQKVPGHPLNWDDGREILAPTLAIQRAAGVALGPSSLVLHRSHDAGLTWTSEAAGAPFDAAFGFPSAARAPDGTLFLSYARGSSANATVEVIWSGDDGASWSEPIIVAREVGFPSVASPFIDARPDGTATITWIQISSTSDRMPGMQLAAARVDPRAEDPLVFSGTITEPYRALWNYEFTMVRHDAEARAHLAYFVEEDGCSETPGATRLHLCLYVLRETSAATAP